MTLSEFLLARIAERERAAYRLDNGPAWMQQAFLGGASFPANEAARRVDECKALRAVVEASLSYHQGSQDPDPEDPDGGWALSVALRALALPYADHPDYRQEWKPGSDDPRT
jgi:hypothetical protein